MKRIVEHIEAVLKEAFLAAGYDEKFANTDKPWTNEKTTALLPIIFRCEVVY